ncbi:MAG: Bacterial pre-peptidase C-terminal domain [Chthonomonadales bacterium]|nr:Bacterial pre-peptidase C-terminal domain [Chthonomonadales bacterium]
MRMSFKAITLPLSLGLIAGFAHSALAQAPELGGLLPAGGVRGQVTKVRIDGKNLKGARLYLSGGGVAVKAVQVTPDGNQLTAEVEVEPGAKLGPHEVRIATAKGVSNGSRFWVDVIPNQVIETPMTESIPPLLLDGVKPIALNGRIAVKAGRDRFVLNAVAGDTWSFDCFADRIRSRFDPVLELRDEAGVSLKLVQSMWESDPRFVYRFDKAGKYFLTVRDSEYNGGPNYTYRLRVGKMAFLAGYSPRGERPGHQVQLALEGTNLTERQASVSIPADAAPGMYWAEVNADKGGPMIVPLMVESEPVLDAGQRETPQALPALPAAVDGVFGKTSRSRFTFHASANAAYLFDLLGRRIGSRIDGQVRVLNAAGKEIAINDDAPDLGKDARLAFTAPAEGDYTVEVSNVEEVLGSDCYYRLKASRVQPDFQLSIATDSLTVPTGGTISLPVTLERIGGFQDAVEVKAEGLPEGVTARTGALAAGKTTLEITLTVAPGAMIAASGIHLIGVASIGGHVVSHEAPAWEKYEHRSIDLGLAVEFSYTRPHHLWDLLLLGIADRTDNFTFAPAPASLTLAPGKSIEIPVHVDRQPNAKNEIKLELRGLPAKVTATMPPIPAGQTEGKITLTAAVDAAPDLGNLILVGHLDNSNTLAPAIQLSVHK